MDYYEEVKTTLLGYLKDAQRAAMNNDLNHFRGIYALGLCKYIKALSGGDLRVYIIFEKILDSYTEERGLSCTFPVEGGAEAYYSCPDNIPHFSDYFWDTSTPYGKARLDFVTDFIKYVEDFDVSGLKEE